MNNVAHCVEWQLKSGTETFFRFSVMMEIRRTKKGPHEVTCSVDSLAQAPIKVGKPRVFA